MDYRNPRSTEVLITLTIRIALPTLQFLDNTSHAIGMPVEELVAMYLQDHCTEEQAIRHGLQRDLSSLPDLFASPEPIDGDTPELSLEAIGAINAQMMKPTPTE